MDMVNYNNDFGLLSKSPLLLRLSPPRAALNVLLVRPSSLLPLLCFGLALGVLLAADET